MRGNEKIKKRERCLMQKYWHVKQGPSNIPLHVCPTWPNIPCGMLYVLKAIEAVAVLGKLTSAILQQLGSVQVHPPVLQPLTLLPRQLTCCQSNGRRPGRRATGAPAAC